MRKSLWVFAGMILLVSGCALTPSQGTEVNDRYEFTDNIEAVSNILVDAPSTRVFFHAHDEDKIVVELKGVFPGTEEEVDQALSTQMSGRSFQVAIQSPINKKWINEDLELHIAVPSKTYGSIQMNVTSKPMQMSDIQSKELIVKSTSGDHVLKGFTGESFKLKATSGNLRLEKFNGKGEIQMTSGDLHLSLQNMDDSISIKNTSGDIYLQVPPENRFFLTTNIREERTKVSTDFATQRSQTSPTLEINQPSLSNPTIQVKTNSGWLYLK